ncbi:MAG: inositol-3-phosphate synthase [Myxococcales bacterium]|nr:inositol-3-phosphate synthase [Myxococcales bacterium]
MAPSRDLPLVAQRRSVHVNPKVRIAIAGVGNCASSLVQGLNYYAGSNAEAATGLMNPNIGAYGVADVEVVAAFDVDPRKIGRPLHEAIFAGANCTTVFQQDIADTGVIVQMGPVLDGVASHFADYPDRMAIRAADQEPVDVAAELKRTRADVLVNFVPVGSELAARHYANACLASGTAMVNCVPVFIASDPAFAEAFRSRGLPIVGDDIKSQFGATILHRILARNMADRGVRLTHTYQLNTGGNTDFLNMLERSRLESKKISKTESVQSQLDTRLHDDDIHVGPSDFVPWQRDNKLCFLRMEWEGFGGVPMHVEARLSVEDSPNSAGVVIDAIRCAKLALDRGEGGPLFAISSYTMKHPPVQLRDSEAYDAVQRYIAHPGNERPLGV